MFSLIKGGNSMISEPRVQPRPQGLVSYWDGDEKALGSAGHMTLRGCHKL